MYSLNAADCRALRLRDAYGLHKVVYSLFPARDGETRDFLYADKGGNANERRVLILSQRVPHSPRYGRIESKTITESFLAWDRYGFEVTLNPTRRDSATKKIVPVRGKENLALWFAGKTPAFGFDIDTERLQVSGTGVTTFEKDGATCTYGTATFVGTLRVTDRQRFRDSFMKGIGRAKGFGFGLLQIIPLETANA
jgi:CRISPR system Cascade subunit CasE